MSKNRVGLFSRLILPFLALQIFRPNQVEAFSLDNPNDQPLDNVAKVPIDDGFAQPQFKTISDYQYHEPNHESEKTKKEEIELIVKKEMANLGLQMPRDVNKLIEDAIERFEKEDDKNADEYSQIRFIPFVVVYLTAIIVMRLYDDNKEKWKKVSQDFFSKYCDEFSFLEKTKKEDLESLLQIVSQNKNPESTPVSDKNGDPFSLEDIRNIERLKMGLKAFADMDKDTLRDLGKEFGAMLSEDMDRSLIRRIAKPSCTINDDRVHIESTIEYLKDAAAQKKVIKKIPPTQIAPKERFNLASSNFEEEKKIFNSER
ncbi:MAG: hypothetical protein K0R25_96 [Rickettsiaceae bacterium]|jgi:hypothetical protein|nr:hypothetical protein [Rickettsiaceae bacterium]